MADFGFIGSTQSVLCKAHFIKSFSLYSPWFHFQFFSTINSWNHSFVNAKPLKRLTTWGKGKKPKPKLNKCHIFCGTLQEIKNRVTVQLHNRGAVWSIFFAETVGKNSLLCGNVILCAWGWLGETAYLNSTSPSQDVPRWTALPFVGCQIQNLWIPPQMLLLESQCGTSCISMGRQMLGSKDTVNTFAK